MSVAQELARERLERNRTKQFPSNIPTIHDDPDHPTREYYSVGIVQRNNIDEVARGAGLEVKVIARDGDSYVHDGILDTVRNGQTLLSIEAIKPDTGTMGKIEKVVQEALIDTHNIP